MTVVAVMIVMLMLALGMGTYAVVDTQSQMSGTERVRESSFNLAEGALNAQTFILGRLGPGNPASQFPQCSNATSSTLCPSPADISRSFDPATQADYNDSSTTWTTSVHDDGSTQSPFYDDSVETAQLPYDADADKQVWVRARAVVRGQARTIVALIKVEDRPVTFPRYALNAGSFSTTNNGNKTIIDTTGSIGVIVRCDEVGEPDPASTCLGYDPGKGQVSPNNYFENSLQLTAVSADDLAGLEELAQANGTHYSTCPANPNGTVVVVDGGNCSYNNSTPAAPGQSKCCNSAASPGVFIVKNGTVSLTGNIELYGIVYGLNQQGTTGNVISLGGTSAIRGGAIVDGPGGVSAGSSGTNLVYDPKAFDEAKSFGTAGVVQNTWRELEG